MYAYEIFETIKNNTERRIEQEGNSCVAGLANDLYRRLIHNEGFDKQTAYDIVMGAFACVACNDGKISNQEYYAMQKIIEAGDNFTYDDFFNRILKYNKQEWRNKTLQAFQSLTDRQDAVQFLYFTTAVALIDNNLAQNEESFITSLCGVVRDRFDL